jgi:hypothetical protein
MQLRLNQPKQCDLGLKPCMPNRSTPLGLIYEFQQKHI